MIKIIAFLLLTIAVASGAKPLQKLENCTLVPTPWADGDSFLVATPDGKQHTMRLYGADCLESQINDTSDSRRLRAQRRYFGITKVGPGARASIEIAKNFGTLGTAETARMLSKPFTVYSAFSDARGDGKYKRVYAFIVTHDGKDLAAHLVSRGLARAFGVSRETYRGVSRDDYQDFLKDFELQAAKRGLGVWARTNWDALPDERQRQREEDAEAKLALDGQPLSEGVTLNPNTAARDDLMKLPGIGEKFANRIIEGRPYAKPDDLLKVSGIGPKTLAKISHYLNFEITKPNQ